MPIPVVPERRHLAGLGYCSHGCKIACELPLSHHGKSTVSLDAKDGHESDVLHWDGEEFTTITGGDNEAPADCESPPELPDPVRERLASFLRLWLRLSPVRQRVLSMRILGATDTEISRCEGVSAQRVHFVTQNARREIPELAAAIAPARRRRKVALAAFLDRCQAAAE